MYDNWRPSKTLPESVGAGFQVRQKKNGGKWNDYSKRVNRDVVFFGIERVVPHYEKSVSKSYRRAFTAGSLHGWEKDVSKIVGKILGIKYTALYYKEHSKYHLPVVSTRNHTYSGFNMGAGENALFEIFTTIYSSPPGVLLVIDEIELGLHEEAQKKFIDELKKICKERQIQVICTTHSSTILRRLPPEGRFYIEKIGDDTIVTQGVTPEFVLGNLAGENTNEIDIFVEDEVAKCIFYSSLAHNLRMRVNMIPIGSPTAIANQMVARYKESKPGECICIMDGDQRRNNKDFKQLFKKTLESFEDEDEVLSWLDKRTFYLPGEATPEQWMLRELLTLDCSKIAERLGISQDKLKDIVEICISADSHCEFYEFSENLHIDSHIALSLSAEFVVKEKYEEFLPIHDGIKNLID